MRCVRICLVFLVVFSSGVAWADILIIAHHDVSEATVSQKDLQQIFLGKRIKWNDATPILPVVLKDQTLHKAFLKQYVKRSSAKWKAHWSRMIFTGTRMPPEEFATQQELLDYVANTAGAIGYIDSETPVENVTIIEVQ